MALGDSATKPIFELGYDARRTSAVPCPVTDLVEVSARTLVFKLGD